MTTGACVRVFADTNALRVSHVYNVLVGAGIDCELRNMILGGAAGELPPGECEPAVWVAAADHARARALVDEALDGPPRPRQAWACPACGEALDGVFDTCWRCGTPHPD
ncbi:MULTISPECIES: DUF2007 domain-containing protein [unclassified Modicisalibacter]|uniref:putative signal transducing protein n=1 Tax=unclassified Modicisalibacter TaxID=2679913 RepID=UPI001CCA71F9|nr:MULTISPECIES: DUF2007 domain-containing protein [unclassified Modicisalibacter]MBZ9558157.1 DUF2007 domain-containing protein [Modicisalibacter sp. R2A 31.J]MBZ9573174.1 DUF2007 domain-containing protein [Modicisalibacter sp. MOD 31.J]